MLLIAKSRDEQNGDVEVLDFFADFEPRQVALDVNVHQNEVRRFAVNQVERCCGIVHPAHHMVADGFHLHFEFEGEGKVIFYDEYI